MVEELRPRQPQLGAEPAAEVGPEVAVERAGCRRETSAAASGSISAGLVLPQPPRLRPRLSGGGWWAVSASCQEARCQWGRGQALPCQLGASRPLVRVCAAEALPEGPDGSSEQGLCRLQAPGQLSEVCR